MTSAIADTFLEHFDDYCTDDRVKPPPLTQAIIGGTALIKDPSTGQPVPVTVLMAPTGEAFHETRLPATGLFSPGHNAVIISPTAGVCKPRSSWKNILLSVIRHELTHALDPGLYRSNRNKLLWEQAFNAWAQAYYQERSVLPAKMFDRMFPPPPVRQLPRQDQAWGKAAIRAVQTDEEIPAYSSSGPARDFCSYVQDPYEARAFLAQIGSELRMGGDRIPKTHPGFATPAAALKALSPTFDILDEATRTERGGKVTKCLLPKDRVRILKMAARTWDEGFLPRRKKA
jgi:hypothetical protein